MIRDIKFPTKETFFTYIKNRFKETYEILINPFFYEFSKTNSWKILKEVRALIDINTDNLYV